MSIGLIASTLETYEPQLPLAELAVKVNQFYHSVEAKDYDQRHAEIHEQLPPIWGEMIQHAIAATRSTRWNIIDFGCGTGFEAEQLIRQLPTGSIETLVCYDPSPEMLEQCRQRIQPLLPTTRFTSSLNPEDLAGLTFNLVTTNSLLHHLPNPVETIEQVASHLSDDVIWLAGHEPSSRFYKNPVCEQHYQAFVKGRQWQKFLQLENYLDWFKRTIGLEVDPATFAADTAFREGLFKKRPDAVAIGRLVDFHVAHSIEEATSGRGFDFEVMRQTFAPKWQLEWVKTYSFMGAFYEGSLPTHWQQISRDLAQQFPQDGANFCTIWRRCGA